MWHKATIESLPEGAIDDSGAVDRYNWQPIFWNLPCNIQTVGALQRTNIVIEYLTKETRITHCFFFDREIDKLANCRLVTSVDYRYPIDENDINNQELIYQYQVIGFGEPVRTRRRNFALTEVYAFRTKRWKV